MGGEAAVMEAEVTEEAMVVLGVVTAVLVAMALDTASPAIVLGVAITAVDGTEDSTGEDAASIPITRIEDMATPTSAFTRTPIPTTLTGTGLPSVIPTGGVTGSGYPPTIKEGNRYRKRWSRVTNDGGGTILKL